MENQPPVPKDLVRDAQKLLISLETWQNTLPSLQRDFELDELAEVDKALSTLIVHLRAALNGGKA
jgi:hypothetical protein